MASVLERRLRCAQLFAAVQLAALSTLAIVEPSGGSALWQIVFVAALWLTLATVTAAPDANRKQDSRAVGRRTHALLRAGPVRWPGGPLPRRGLHRVPAAGLRAQRASRPWTAITDRLTSDSGSSPRRPGG